ncbi:MAG: hypothetical protein Q8N51_09715 [Gammaproteobacteria bacterium]|nr:hypothetical protein [Gammaproteobacteria bacterium]
MNATTPTIVGRFTYDPQTKNISGPARYMQSGRLEKVLDQIRTRQSIVFNEGCRLGHGGISLILVCVQTDFAAWAGEQELLAHCKG